MRRGFLQALIAAGVAVGTARVSATIIVDQLPTYLGGPHADTEFLDIVGTPGWQRIADNIRLSQSAVVRHVAWYGFYGGDEQNHEPPIGIESMRIRFYRASPSNGLPDESNILFGETFVGLPRTTTGQEVFVQGNPDEYRFETDLTSEVHLSANETYWLEIAQIGDRDSTFRWETGFGSVPSFAYSGHLTMGEWLTTGGSMAFQLSSIPEPTTSTLLICTLSLFLARRAPRRMPGACRRRTILLAATICFMFDTSALAEIIIDQQPDQGGGFGSDTEFLNDFGESVWQREADNIRLGASAVVRRVSWYGFYGGDDQSHEPPAGAEIMRVRFYGSLAGDGLPDDSNIFLEQVITNLPRTPTGRTIAVQGRPAEYLFQSDLQNEVLLLADTTYWLEIVQIGDFTNTFRWETGFGSLPGHAFTNNIEIDWTASSGSFAFQLSSIPEPSTGLLSLCVLWLALARRAPRRMRGGTHKQ